MGQFTRPGNPPGQRVSLLDHPQISQSKSPPNHGCVWTLEDRKKLTQILQFSEHGSDRPEWPPWSLRTFFYMLLQAPSKMDNRQFELPPSSRTVFNRLQQSFTKLLLLRPCEGAFWAPQHTATSSYLLRPKTKSILLVPGTAPQKCYKSRRHIYDTSIWDGT